MNTAIVTTTAATVSPFIQNLQQQQPQKPQTSKEAIAANVKALIEQLEEGQSEGLTAYLMATPHCNLRATGSSGRAGPNRSAGVRNSATIPNAAHGISPGHTYTSMSD
jgi:hypothetical protein